MALTELTEQAKAARREYKRKWNAANKDKVKAAQLKYWNNRAAAQEAQQITDKPQVQEV